MSEEQPLCVDYTVIPMEEHHFPQVSTLWENRIGAPDDLIDTWLADIPPRSKPTEGFVVQSDGNILGFAIACIADPDYVETYINHPDVSIDAWEKTGILHVLCVDADHENQGIGSQLVQARLRWLESVGCEGVLGVSWHRDAHNDSRSLFQKFAFEPAAVVDEFYATTTDDPHCVDCPGSCTCDATIFQRKLPQKTT